MRRPIPLSRRFTYAAVIYSIFLLVLLAIEVVTRVTLPHLSSLDLFVTSPQQKMQVANAQQSTIFEGDPLLLWRLRPNLNNVVWDFTVVSTNAQHYRADYPIATKPSGTFRIVCLGDSVTFGYRVPAVWPNKPDEFDPEALPFPMLLEKHLRQVNRHRRIEVFAMAVPGYTTHQGLAWLRRDIDFLDPDLVIASFGWNDTSASDVADREAIRTDWSPFTIRWLIDHSQAFAHATRWLRSQGDSTQLPARKPGPRVAEPEYVSNFLEITKLVRAKGSGVLVLGAPYRDTTTNPPEAELMTRYRNALRLALQRQNVAYLEILELTETAESINEGFFGELIHPNHMGHRLITSELLKSLLQNNLLGDLNAPEFVP